MPDSWRNWAAQHPEWWSLVLSGFAWLALLVLHAGAQSQPSWLQLCLAGPRDDGQGRMMLTGVLMVIAMLPPLAVPAIHHVAVRSLATRRDGAMAVFLLGACWPWLLVCVGVSLSMAWLSAWPAWCGFALAAVWQLTPIKRRALLRCHRSFPLAISGWAAHCDCFRYGTRYGAGCVVSCWAMMAAVMLAGHAPAVGLCVQILAWAERQVQLPRLGVSATALAGGAAFYSFL